MLPRRRDPAVSRHAHTPRTQHDRIPLPPESATTAYRRLGELLFLCSLAPFHLHLFHVVLHFIDLFFHGLVVTLEGHRPCLEIRVLLLQRRDLCFQLLVFLLLLLPAPGEQQPHNQHHGDPHVSSCLAHDVLSSFIKGLTVNGSRLTAYRFIQIHLLSMNCKLFLLL